MQKLIIPFLLLFSITISAQSNKANLVLSNTDETVINFTFQSYDLEAVNTPQGEAFVVVADKLTEILELGAPDLPKITESIIIPDLANMQVEVLSSDFIEIKNINIVPSKGNLLRNVNPADVPYEYGPSYSKDAFYPGKLASLNNPYIIRDYRGQAVQVFPFQYNPVSKTLRVYSEIQVKVSVENINGVNQFVRDHDIEKVSTEFSKIYKRHFINHDAFQNRYTPLEEEGNMLIICHDPWTAEMQAFVDWKNTIGRPCEMVTVTDAGGTASNIKTYVENYYNTNGLTFLLLIGDSDQVPTNIGGGLGGHSDNAYGYITGSDHYQELFVGRFSAENVDHVNTQVERTLEYEMGDQLAADWLNRVMSVGSNQGPGDDGEMDYEHLRNIQTDLFGFTYVGPPYEHFDGSQGGDDDPGNPTPTGVGTDINSGLGIINYTGHGSTTSWGSSGFSNSNINSLTNDNKLPFIWTVACVNGAFVGTTCFGEAWLRAENNNEPTGAIAIFAATINQSWSPPMCGQDEMNDLLVGTATNGTKRTYAGISVNGCFQMNDEYGVNGDPMTDTWTCFGDPSLLVRTDNPANMVITHNTEVIVGETTFDVTCDLEGALATLTDENAAIIGSAPVSGGIAAIPVSGLTPGTTLTLAVVGFNKVTYLTSVIVIAPSGSYLVVDSYVNTIDFGQTDDLDIALKNVGVSDAINVNATVTTIDPNASLSNATYSYGTITAGTTSAPSSGAFTLTVADDVPDQHTVEIEVVMTDDSGSWTTTKNVTVNAPVLAIGDLSIDDTVSGDGNGILDPGETADLIIQATNTGHADVTNVISAISTTFVDMTINTATAPTASLNVGVTGNFVFNVTVDAAVAPGTPVIVSNDITAGVNNQYSAQKDHTIIIGFVPEYCPAGADTTTDEFIQQVQFGDIDNTSTQGPAYSDYTSFSTDIQVGESYPITIINGESWASDQMGCWIDWNYDGDFEDADEYIIITYAHDTPSTGLGTGTGTVTVPAGAWLGSTRMRLRVLFTGDILPCGNSSYGEVEDYTVNVFDPYASVTENVLIDINIYPNPNEGTFMVNLDNMAIDETVQIEVFNINGQLVYQVETAQRKQSINLSETEGVYFIKITSGTQVANKKIIIK